MTEKNQKLIELILGLDPAEVAHFTKAQLPDSRVLAEKLGESVTAAERDEAFAAFAEQYPDEAAALKERLTPKTEEKASAEPTTEKKSTMITGQDALKHLRSKGHKI